MSTAAPPAAPVAVRQRHRALPLLLLTAGLVLALVAVAVMTVARPTTTVTATASVRSGAPLVLTAPGVLESRDGPVTVRARGEGRLVLAVGRTDDVTAWAGDTARTTVTRLSSASVLAVRDRSGATTAPDPAGSDLWVQQATGTGSASLTHHPQPGSWLLLAAGDGSSPAPRTLTLGWREHRAPAWAVPVLVVGALALAAGALLLLRARRGGAAGSPAGTLVDAPTGVPADGPAGPYGAPAGTAAEDAR